jgi:hypothetical protein
MRKKCFEILEQLNTLDIQFSISNSTNVPFSRYVYPLIIQLISKIYSPVDNEMWSFTHDERRSFSYFGVQLVH